MSDIFFTQDHINEFKRLEVNLIYVNNSLIDKPRTLKNNDSVILKNSDFWGKQFKEVVILNADGERIEVDVSDPNEARFYVRDYNFPTTIEKIVWVGDEVDPEPEPEPIETEILNNLYSIDSNTMKKLVDENLNIIITNNGELEDVDYSPFIINCLLLPFKLPDDYIGEDSKIFLGQKTVDLSSPTIKDDFIEVDLGSVQVPKGDSLLDYQTTKIIMRLPFTDAIELPIDYVLGYEIGVKYVVNLYTGETTVNVSSSGYEKYISSTVVNIGVDMPLPNYKRSPALVVNGEVSLPVNNHRDKFSIEVLKNVEALPDNKFSIPIKDYGLIDRGMGFVQVENIELDGVLLSDDSSDLINILTSGIIV